MTEKEKIVITKYDLLYEQRMVKVETSLEKLEKNLDRTFRGIDDTFKEIRSDLRELRMDFKWILGLMIMFSGILLSVMAKSFHWL